MEHHIPHHHTIARHISSFNLTTNTYLAPFSSRPMSSLSHVAHVSSHINTPFAVSTHVTICSLACHISYDMIIRHIQNVLQSVFSQRIKIWHNRSGVCVHTIIVTEHFQQFFLQDSWIFCWSFLVLWWGVFNDGLGGTGHLSTVASVPPAFIRSLSWHIFSPH